MVPLRPDGYCCKDWLPPPRVSPRSIVSFLSWPKENTHKDEGRNESK